MPCPPWHRWGMAAGANPHGCTMYAATWCDANNVYFGECRICAAAAAGARSGPEPSACRLPERLITKRECKKFSRACAHAVLGEGCLARIVPADGFHYGGARLIDGGRDMAQQEPARAHVLGKLSYAERRCVQRIENGRGSGRVEYHGVEYQ